MFSSCILLYLALGIIWAVFLEIEESYQDQGYCFSYKTIATNILLWPVSVIYELKRRED